MARTLILLTSFCTFMMAMSAKNMINQYGCMECHGIKKGKTAPAFKRISQLSEKKSIMKSIRYGSQGKYKDYSQNIMPEFNYFTDKELNILADWIKELKSEK